MRSHAQSSLAAAAAAEYFAQIWLGSRRGGRNPVSTRGTLPVGRLPSRAAGAGGRARAAVGRAQAAGGRARASGARLTSSGGRERAGAVGSGGRSQGRARLCVVTAPSPHPRLSLLSSPPLGGAGAQRTGEGTSAGEARGKGSSCPEDGLLDQGVHVTSVFVSVSPICTR